MKFSAFASLPILKDLPIKNQYLIYSDPAFCVDWFQFFLEEKGN